MREMNCDFHASSLILYRSSLNLIPLLDRIFLLGRMNTKGRQRSLHHVVKNGRRVFADDDAITGEHRVVIFRWNLMFVFVEFEAHLVPAAGGKLSIDFH